MQFYMLNASLNYQIDVLLHKDFTGDRNKKAAEEAIAEVLLHKDFTGDRN